MEDMALFHRPYSQQYRVGPVQFAVLSYDGRLVCSRLRLLVSPAAACLSFWRSSTQLHWGSLGCTLYANPFAAWGGQVERASTGLPTRGKIEQLVWGDLGGPFCKWLCCSAGGLETCKWPN